MRTVGIVLLVLLTGCAGSRVARFTPDHVYSPEVLHKDFRVLTDIIEADHPSLYWYTSSDSIKYYFAQADASLGRPMTEGAFRNVVAATLSHIRCGHTGVRPSVQYEDYTARHPEAQFPFQVKILGLRDQPCLALVFNPYVRDSTFKAGDIITSINGLPASTLIDSLRRFFSVDGYCYNFAYQRISGDFPLNYQSVFGSDSIYSVGVSRPGKPDFTAPVKAYDLQTDTTLAESLKIWEMGAPFRMSKREELQQLRSLRIDSSGKLAVLTIRTFDDGLRKDFIRESFEILRREKIPNLVVDLRTNSGGQISNAILLARYLKPADFVFMDSVYSTTRHISYKHYMDRTFLPQLGMTFLTRKHEDGYYHFTSLEGKRYHPIRRDHYKGHVYVLTGGFTFSAASIFTANMKGTPDVTIVGEETGGGYYGNDGIYIPDVTLPGTHLRVSLPLFRMVTNHNFPKDGRGVPPDIEVVPSPSDISGAVDPKMRRVLELVGLPVN